MAVNEAIDHEMTRDPRVILMGEDIVGGAGSPGEDDAWGGVLGVTKGLYAKHGNRVDGHAASESAYIGAAIGAAACGMRPIAELMFIDFIGCVSTRSSTRRRSSATCSAARPTTPVVIRSMMGAGLSRRRAAFADADADRHTYSGPQGRLSVERLRRQGTADPVDPRQRPGHLLRTQKSLFA